jgi:hypothetical protein
MKKLYVLLTAMLIVSVSFAQISTTKKVVKTDGTTINIKGTPAQVNQQKNATNTFWFNLIEDAYNYYGAEPSGFAPPIQCDTLGLFNFEDGLSPVQFGCVGQVYNWGHDSWNYMYNYSGAPENVPYMPTATSYTVDSLQMIYLYTRGTNVASTVVDTIAFSYIIGLDEGDDIAQLATNDGPVFIMPVLPFNNTTFTASTTCATTTGLTNDLESSTIIIDKIPLTADDETIDPEDGEAAFFYLTIPTPAALQNISAKQIVVIATFIPGCDRTPTSVIGTDLSTFRTALYGDPRDGYTDWGSPELLEDYQLGLFTDGDNFKAGGYFYNVYQPNVFWGSNPKPWLSLRVTCNNCAVVNVPEIEKNNVTVYPNPATNNFTVNLGNDEKANIQLFNILGQQVYSENITGTAQVSVANLNSGVYMLKINQNGKVYTSKVVVK